MLKQIDSNIQQRLGLSVEEIVDFCQKWNIIELSLFGSVLSDQFRPDSDIDILINFSSNARQGLLTLAKLKHELEDKIGREVDVALKDSVENSENWIRRNDILTTAQVIYEQR